MERLHSEDIPLNGEPILRIEELSCEFRLPGKVLKAVDNISLSVGVGERLAIVGESGSGKSVTALATMRLLEGPGTKVSGEIHFRGRNLARESESELSKIRGREMSMVFQDPFASLNPVRTIGSQLIEAVRRAGKYTKRESRANALGLLDEVGLPDPELQFKQYPHELSGGMNQRSMIAIALAGKPSLLIADEPTTALDATSSSGILALLERATERRGMSVVFISHDLRAVADFAQRIAIMYAGRILEVGSADRVFRAPQHPYTRGLLKSIPGATGRHYVPTMIGGVPDLTARPSGCVFHPRCAVGQSEQRCTLEVPVLSRASVHRERPAGQAVACHFANERSVLPIWRQLPERKAETAEVRDQQLVSVSELSKEFTSSSLGRERRRVQAVRSINFDIREAETLALVGESGSGKTTAARMILGLERPTEGTIRFEGRDLRTLTRQEWRRFRQKVQVVFQSPANALNPKLTVLDVVTEPLVAQRIGSSADRRQRAGDLLEKVGLQPTDMIRYPHEFSGGQKQRIGIARALATNPSLIICDEPVTALDVSVQGNILNLLLQLQQEERVAHLLIAHDLDVVRQVADRIAVMQRGEIVEQASAEQFFAGPSHPFSKRLLASSTTSQGGLLASQQGHWLSG